MAVSDQDLDTAKQTFVDNSNALAAIVQGNDTADVAIGGGKTLPSIAKLQKQVLQDYAHVEQQANRDVSGGYPSLTGYKLNLQNVAGAVKSYLASLATASRNWQLPDKDGTVAMTSDITATAVGLNLVNNTADADKPISTLQATAFAARELLANKAVDFSTVNDTKYPSVQAVKAYVDNATAGVLNDRGNWDASGNAYPNANGSGTGGAIRKGDIYYISVAGTIGGQAVSVGDSIRALKDTPGTTAANWNILDANINYVAENNANKDATGGYAGLTLFKLNVMNAAGSVKSFLTTTATAARTYTFPDKDGTVAMISDLGTPASGTNTGDETTATILNKLGISAAGSFAAGVLATTLTGLGAGSNTAIAAGNTLLAALANLQAQIKAIPYDFKFYTGAIKPLASAEIFFDKAARAYTIPANFAGSTFESLLAATGATVWTLNRTTTGGSTAAIGTISWAANGTVPTLATTGGVAINVLVGEKVTLVAAATQDATLAKVSGTIIANLT